MRNLIKKHKKIKVVSLALILVLFSVLIIFACENCQLLSSDLNQKIQASHNEHPCCKEKADHHSEQKKSCKCCVSNSVSFVTNDNLINSLRKDISRYGIFNLVIILCCLISVIYKDNFILYVLKKNLPPIFLVNCSLII